LRSALLGPGDLPDGFTAHPPADLGGDFSVSGCSLLSEDPAGMTASAAVALNRGGPLGTTLTETLMQLSTGDATAAITRYAGLSTSCHTFTATVSGSQITFTTTPLDFPSLGDGTVAARIVASFEGIGTVAAEDVVIVRRGGTLILLSNAGSSSVDSGLTVSSARTSLQKVAARW